MERTRGRYRRANFVIATLVYLAVLYGTFLTRSGVLADFSVHSFVDLGISGWLVALMAVFVALPTVLMVLRLREVPTVRNEDPLLSRGSFLVLSTIAVGAATLVISVGTSAPLITRALGIQGQVGPEFYNRVNQPIAVLIALLLALVPLLGWKGAGLGETLRRLWLPALVGLGAAGVAGWLGVHHPAHLAIVLLGTTAAVTNLEKAFARAKQSGLRAAGGWLAHVGVGIILIGFLASSAYDQSAKVTLTQGVPAKVGDLTLTFHGFLPRTASEKERMEVLVERAGGGRYLAYPKMFINDRTRQVMVNPHIRKLPLQDIYLSPIDYDPGQPAGAPQRLQLAKGETVDLGDVELAFEGFDLEAGGTNAMAAMERGQPIVIGAALAVRRGAEVARITPLYSFTQGGVVDARPVDLPGGGRVLVSGINATAGAVQLDVAGVGADEGGVPSSLSLDVTRKPLIQLVWFGLYIVLAGGGIAAFQRFRQARGLERQSEKA
jgi:cytochrome c-type biogenesis protein CcmF